MFVGGATAWHVLQFLYVIGLQLADATTAAIVGTLTPRPHAGGRDGGGRPRAVLVAARRRRRRDGRLRGARDGTGERRRRGGRQHAARPRRARERCWRRRRRAQPEAFARAVRAAPDDCQPVRDWRRARIRSLRPRGRRARRAWEMSSLEGAVLVLRGDRVQRVPVRRDDVGEHAARCERHHAVQPRSSRWRPRSARGQPSERCCSRSPPAARWRSSSSGCSSARRRRGRGRRRRCRSTAPLLEDR